MQHTYVLEQRLVVGTLLRCTRGRLGWDDLSHTSKAYCVHARDVDEESWKRDEAATDQTLIISAPKYVDSFSKCYAEGPGSTQIDGAQAIVVVRVPVEHGQWMGELARATF